MLQYITTRWQLFIVLCLFIVIKQPALHYPFFLDESWSYAPGVKLMYLHGPSLMPNAIDLFYSRGHPMLFYAAAAAWMKVFGSSTIVQHWFALCISCLLLAAVFEVGIKLFNKRIAILSLLLMPLQVMFYVQSTLLLPELMIAWLSLLTLLYYVQEKHKHTFLCCAALLFTKESGMVMGLVLGLHATSCLLNRKTRAADSIKRFLSIFVAGMLIGMFYLLQNKLNGWYLFPEHTGLISWNWDTFWHKFQYSLEVLFVHDNRYHLFRLLFMLGIVVAVYHRDARYAMPLLPGLLVYAAIENRLGFLPRKVLFVLLLLSLLYTVYQLLIFLEVKEGATKKFTWLSAFFFIAYLCFCCVNFFTVRYLSCLLAVELIVVASYFVMYVSRLYELIWYLTMACIALTGYYGFKNDTRISDVSLAAFDAMNVEQDIVNYFEREQLYDKNIFASFINSEHLQKPLTGFRHSDAPFKNITFEITPTTDYIILDNIDSVKQFYEIKNNKDYHVIYKTQKGEAWAEVYVTHPAMDK